MPGVARCAASRHGRHPSTAAAKGAATSFLNRRGCQRNTRDSPLGRVCNAVQIRRSNDLWPCGPSEPMQLLDAAAGIVGCCQAVPSGETGNHVARRDTHCKHALTQFSPHILLQLSDDFPDLL
jgi:hypothetical protein